MKARASTAAMIRVCEVRWTLGSVAASASAAHRSASTCARPELPDHQHDQPLEDEEGRAQRGQEGGPAGALQHPHRHLLDPQALAHGELQRLDLGEVGRVALAEQRHHPPVRRPHAAGRVGEALPRRQGEEEAEDAGADPPRERRLVVVALGFAGFAVARADHQVGAVGRRSPPAAAPPRPADAARRRRGGRRRHSPRAARAGSRSAAPPPAPG